MAQDTTRVALSAADQEALRRLALGLAAALPHDVLEVRLFGSRARGDAKPWSDVDVLIVARDAEAADRIRDATEGLRKTCWSDDSPGLTSVVLEEADFRRHQAARSLLYRDLRDQGIPLWQNGVDLWNEGGIAATGRERDVRFHLDQAQEALDVANLALGDGHAGSAAARAYYAAFHAASAALLTENIERAKHGTLIGEFDRLCRQNRLLGNAFHGKLLPLYNLRQVADYGNVYVKDKDAREATQTAERFVEEARAYCQKWLERQGPER